MSNTKECSTIQERRVASKLDGTANASSGAGKFNKGDVVLKHADMLVECKTCMTPKNSFSIKKEWIEKLNRECYSMGMTNGALAFNFDYQDSKDYFVIDDRLMAFLVEKLEEYNS